MGNTNKEINMRSGCVEVGCEISNAEVTPFDQKTKVVGSVDEFPAMMLSGRRITQKNLNLHLIKYSLSVRKTSSGIPLSKACLTARHTA